MMYLPFRPSLRSLLHRKRWKKAISRLKTPLGIRQARKPNYDGFYPLHHALQMGSPPSLLLALVRAFPGAAGYVDADGVLPLHRCFVSVQCNQDFLQVVEALLQAYPEAARVATHEGVCLPLHLACNTQGGEVAVKVTECLLRAYPEGAAVRHRYGRLPLHVACCGWAKGESVVDVVKALLNVYPAAARTPTPAGNLPLHLVLGSVELAGGPGKAPYVAELCKLLLDVYPEAALVPDAQGVSWGQRCFQLQWRLRRSDGELEQEEGDR